MQAREQGAAVDDRKHLAERQAAIVFRKRRGKGAVVRIRLAETHRNQADQGFGGARTLQVADGLASPADAR
jgi:hypothetical protein